MVGRKWRDHKSQEWKQFQDRKGQKTGEHLRQLKMRQVHWTWLGSHLWSKENLYQGWRHKEKDLHELSPWILILKATAWLKMFGLRSLTFSSRYSPSRNPGRRKQRPAQSGWSPGWFLINGQCKENPETSRVTGCREIHKDSSVGLNHCETIIWSLLKDKQKNVNLKDNLSYKDLSYFSTFYCLP